MAAQTAVTNSTETPPDGWEQDERAAALRREGDEAYVDYVHETGDVRVRIAPPDADPVTHGHGVSATLYPYTDISSTVDVRTVSSRPRARRIARTVMELFNALYARSGDVEESLEYALVRTRPDGGVDDAVSFDE